MSLFPDVVRIGSGSYAADYALQEEFYLAETSRQSGLLGLRDFIDRSSFHVCDAGELASGLCFSFSSRYTLIRGRGDDEEAKSYSRRFFPVQNFSLAPVYFAQGRGIESAVSPRLDVLVIKLKSSVNELYARADLRDKFGLVCVEELSKFLAPFKLFRWDRDGRGARERLHAFELYDFLKAIPYVERVELDWLKLLAYDYDSVCKPMAIFDQWNLRAINGVGLSSKKFLKSNISMAIIDDGVDLGNPNLRFTADGTHCSIEDQDLIKTQSQYLMPVGCHGTLVAGVAAALPVNGSGPSGVAPGCPIMSVKVGGAKTASRIAAAVGWAVDHGAKVINMSFMCETCPADVVVQKLADAWSKDVLLCASSGNYYAAGPTPISFPASHENVIAVGASDRDDRRVEPLPGLTWGSSFGEELDVCAPGVDCWSTLPQLTGHSFGTTQGTSVASPHVTGLVAVICAEYPVLSNAKVREAIEGECFKNNLYAFSKVQGHAFPWQKEVGYGRIDCWRSLKRAAKMALLVRIKNVAKNFARKMGFKTQ